MNVVEICAGAGGQSIGFERAGLEHVALVELDADCCRTLRRNRPEWNVVEDNVRAFDGKPYAGIDILAGGIPCPPFSKAGRQLGENDDRDLFPEVLRLTSEIRPKAVMIENVKGLLDRRFDDYRKHLEKSLHRLGFGVYWKCLNAADFGVPQSRHRVVMIALAAEYYYRFEWPAPKHRNVDVGGALADLMAANGWQGARQWASLATSVAPTIVGGSRKHGGPDLGPTRSREAWRALGVDGRGIADDSPAPDFVGMPRLTTRMAARLQGFPDDWIFVGKKTSVYRQVGNAFPPHLSCAVATQLKEALSFQPTMRLAL